ncbi:MAG: hypothetical protein QOI61_2089 [Actinomycetota bacterium]|jgi:hypothetical protein
MVGVVVAGLAVAVATTGVRHMRRSNAEKLEFLVRFIGKSVVVVTVIGGSMSRLNPVPEHSDA